MRLLSPATRPLEHALALAPALLTRTEADGEPRFAVSVVEGRAIVLGATQRAGRVVDVGACARAGLAILRRHSTGFAARLEGRALVATLALPHVASLFPDATARTLLNRNVRALLRALASAGLAAHYFGRATVSIRRRPAALLGFDVTREGSVLLEMLLPLDASIALPPALAAPAELELARFADRAPAALAELVDAPVDPRELAAALTAALARFDPAASYEDAPLAEVDLARPVTHPASPAPASFEPLPPTPVPAGFLDAAADPSSPCIWLGGDALAPRWLYDDLATRLGDASCREAAEAAPIEGARAHDLLAAAARAAMRP